MSDPFFLATHQFRLRDLIRITGHNITTSLDDGPEQRYFYTIHNKDETIPLFTSVESTGRAPLTLSPPSAATDTPPCRPLSVDWPKIRKEFDQNSPLQSIVVRLWMKTHEGRDTLLRTYGIHFSGLVPYAKNLQLSSNALVLHTHSGYSFTAPDSIQRPRVAEGDGVVVTAEESPLSDLHSRYRSLAIPRGSEKAVCRLDQLLKLQQSQLRLKYKRELLQSLTWEIQSKSAICMDPSSTVSSGQYYHRREHSHNNHHHHHAVGSMGKTLTRLLNMEPERVDPKTLQEAFQLRKTIEAVRVRCRLLAVEQSRARRYVEALERQQRTNCDKNVEADSRIMANYHAMNKEKEQYLHFKLQLTKNMETLATVRRDWGERKLILLREICDIYDVRDHEGPFYTINGICLPDAEGYEVTHVPATSISVALGYVAHMVLVTSSVLAVPLRNPIIFRGSESQIMGQVQIMNTNV